MQMFGYQTDTRKSGIKMWAFPQLNNTAPVLSTGGWHYLSAAALVYTRGDLNRFSKV